jgi:hypothetical protein
VKNDGRAAKAALRRLGPKPVLGLAPEILPATTAAEMQVKHDAVVALERPCSKPASARGSWRKKAG